jgi:hypothetical protein
MNCKRRSGDDDVGLKTHELSRELGKSIGVGATAADIENQVFPLYVAQLSHSMAKSFDKGRSLGSGRGHEEPDPGNFPCLLRLSNSKQKDSNQ